MATMPPPAESQRQNPDGTDQNQDGSSDDKAQEAPRVMSADDARTNFSTVVESFIASHSPDGYWPVRQKTTGKVLRLKFQSVSSKTVHEANEGHYRGLATLREVQTDTLVKAEFTVDFSGPRWDVLGMRLLSVKAAPAKPAKTKAKAKAAPAAPPPAPAQDQPAPADDSAQGQ